MYYEVVLKMNISEFKARCIAVLKAAQQSGETILVTRRGQPLARVEPVRSHPSERPLGVHGGRLKIRGDLVGVDFADDWEING